MSIRVVTRGNTDLRLASVILKRNLGTAITVNGAAGKVVGFWRAFFFQPNGFTENGLPALLGYEASISGAYAGGNDSFVRFGGSGFTSLSLRPRHRIGATAIDATGITPVANGSNFLVVDGVVNAGTDASPVWRMFIAVCPVGSNSVSSVVTNLLSTDTAVTSTSSGILGNIFSAAGSSTTRTPLNTAIEQVAVVHQGDFPWDTANGRPHHDAIAALAGGGANPFLTYQTLVAAQNAGNTTLLPYANLRMGSANAGYQWSLSTIAGGLANTWSGGPSNSLSRFSVVDLNGLGDFSNIAPSHWYPAPTIVDPPVKFIGGRGARAVALSGLTNGATQIERRWEVAATNTAVAGFDWADCTVAGGNWSRSDTLPVGGPYRLRVRDKLATTQEATPSADWLVGTILMCHGQSGMNQAWLADAESNNGTGSNYLSLSTNANAVGAYLKLSGQIGGSSTTFTKPVPQYRQILPSTTPAVGQGVVAALNNWAEINPGHPLLIVNIAVNGSGMVDWANNTRVYDGSSSNLGPASWTFLGPTTPTEPDATNSNNSGLLSYYAWLLGGYVDCHTMMWIPGISLDSAVRASYVAGVDARFANATSAPWLIFPTWRGQRPSGDASGGMAVREAAIDLVSTLGSRGFLAPHLPDIVMNNSGSLHSAFAAVAGIPAIYPVPDTNHVGQARLGYSIGRSAARVFNSAVKSGGPRLLDAWWTDAAVRTQIQIELGRKCRTLNGAAIDTSVIWVSTDNGTNWTNAGFTAAFDATGTRLVLTSTGGAWPAGTTKVDYARAFPFTDLDEANTERLLDGLIYDDQVHRGGTNLATRAGNALFGTNRAAGANAGVAVTARGAAALMTTERFTGTRNVQVRMRRASDNAVLATKTITVTAS